MRRDAIAGVTVAVVLVPQSLAYAGVAGMPAITGLYAAALPPIVAAIFASSPYLQTGPVAITSLLTFATLSTRAAPGSEEYVALGILLALMVGLVRIAIGAFRLGVVAHLMSAPVLRGFLPAAALVIAASQLPAVVGVEAGGSILGAAADAALTPREWELGAIGFSAATLLVILAALRINPLVPGVLVALAGATAISGSFDYGGLVVGEIPSRLPEIPGLPLETVPGLLLPAAVIALVGFAEAASVAKTFAAQDRRGWDADREFIGQGAANLASGLSGAFPVGGSLSRSALNRMAGASTRASGAFTGVVVLAFIPFARLLEPLPTAVLATIVIVAVSKLALEIRHTVALWGISRPQSVIAWSTFGLTLVLAPRVDLAVVIGITLAIAWHLIRDLRVDLHASSDGALLTVRPTGVLWFGTAESLQQRVITLLEHHPGTTSVRLDLGGLGRIDVTGALALRSLCDNLRAASINVEIRGLPEQAVGLAARVNLEGVGSYPAAPRRTS